jgi:uncharacterized protein YceH (UPF0502 family)
MLFLFLARSLFYGATVDLLTTRHNPSILELLGKDKYPDILTKQDVRGEISLECARHAIIGYLLLKGQQWHHKIVTVLEKETTCLRKSDKSKLEIFFNKTSCGIYCFEYHHLLGIVS